MVAVPWHRSWDALGHPIARNLSAEPPPAWSCSSGLPSNLALCSCI